MRKKEKMATYSNSIKFHYDEKSTEYFHLFMMRLLCKSPSGLRNFHKTVASNSCEHDF